MMKNESIEKMIEKNLIILGLKKKMLDEIEKVERLQLENHEAIINIINEKQISNELRDKDLAEENDRYYQDKEKREIKNLVILERIDKSLSMKEEELIYYQLLNK